MVDVFIVSKPQVAKVWELVAFDLERALERGAGEYSSADMRDFCERGAWQLWVAVLDGSYAAVACTSIQHYPRTRILYVHAYAGTKERAVTDEAWCHLIEFARITGCSCIQFFGRLGWSRSGVLPEGARKTHEVWTLKVE